MLFYSVTEAGFRCGLLWITFLLGAIAVPGFSEDRVESAAAPDYAGNPERLLNLPLETTGQWG
jgi:hypothetical protein